MDECLKCRSRLVPIDKRTSRCENPACPAGGTFYFCGYCRMISFALSPQHMYCVNPDCRSFERVRQKCPSCTKISLMNHNGRRVCVNRECPDNRSIIASCFFCSNRAFLRDPDFMFCTKGDCRQLFSRVEACAFCKQQSFDVGAKECKNSACARTGYPVDPCPRCRQRTLNNGACLAEGCGFKEGTAEAIPDDFGATLSGAPPPRKDETHHQPPPPVTPKPFPAPRPEPPRNVPAPPPPPPPLPPPRPPLRPAAALTPIEQVWAHLKSRFVTSREGHSPIHMVVGLAGAGKTTYLTMVGDILRSKSDKYCYPYEGVDSRWVKIDEGLADGQHLALIRSRVKDLVSDFAQEKYTNSLGRMHWPATTPPDGGEESSPSTFFLVTEISRHHKSLGHIITLETSGEEYEEVLRRFTGYMSGASPQSPVHRVLIDMLTHAEGILILLDPDEAHHNDAVYGNFFMVVKEELRPRALNVLSTELKKLLPGYGQGRNLMDQFSDMVRQEAQRMAWEKRFAEELRLTAERLQDFEQKLRKKDESVLAGADGQWLRSIEALLERHDPEGIREGRKSVQQERDPAAQREAIRRFYRSVCRNSLDGLEPLLRLQKKDTHEGPSESQLYEIRKRFGLSEHFKVDLSAEMLEERPVKHFKCLRNVAIVVTQSDRCPIVHPPQDYPRQKLPGCWQHLRDLEDYLKLCGGAVRFYNASATGYTTFSSGTYIPGWPTSQTPINIIEPLFDMMQVRG